MRMSNVVTTQIVGNAGHHDSMPLGTFMPKNPELAAGIIKMMVMVVSRIMMAFKLLLMMLE